MTRRQFQRQKEAERQKLLKTAVRKHLSADALIRSIRSSCGQVGETRKGEPEIPMEDALMSAFAMFSLKDPSLLAFERRRLAEENNLRSIYKMNSIPSDTQMRTILDPVPPDELRPAHNALLSAVQRGKALEKMAYLEQGYLMPLDGTGYFSSDKLFSPACLQKTSSSGKITYHLQMLGAALVHPERKEVIPLIPEIISRQDGKDKNDCELNASRRFLIKFHQDHPHLEIIVTQDAISPNGPYVMFLKALGYHFILTVKEADHTHLFAHLDDAIKKGQVQELTLDDPVDPKKFHFFRWVNGLPINGSHKDLLINLLEYWQVQGENVKRFCWISDITLTQENVYRVMRAGRAHWKIENETFNTLKNQGYNFEHNYGLGKQNLSMVFVKLMMLAFLVDQVQQLCCALFQTVLKKLGCKKALWEDMRSLFRCLKLESMEMLYRALLHGFTKLEPIIGSDTS
jgi:hypothetical protein